MNVRNVLQKIVCLLLICGMVIGGSVSFTAKAAEATSLVVTSTSETAARGKTYRAKVSFSGSSSAEISAFRLRISYDEDYLTLTSIEPSFATTGSGFRYCATSHDGVVVFASVSQAVSMANGDCCTLVFDVNEEAPVGSTDIIVQMDQMASLSSDGTVKKRSDTYTAGLTVEMEKLLSKEALLTFLEPSSGSLTPNFSPEVTEYTMTVPADVSSLTFDTVASEGATCRVDRKNLKPAGTDTTFCLKVTSEDGKAVTEYVITVTREAASAEESSQPEVSLTALTPSAGTLSPAFSPDIKEYTLEVPYEVTSLTFAATVSEGASYRVNRKNLGAVGEETVYTITVTSQDRTVTTTYQVTATRLPQESTDDDSANEAVLTALTPSAGTLSPSFSADVTHYTMTVPYAVTSLTFDGTVSNGGSFTVRRKNLNSPGIETNFTIAVKDADGTTVKEYVVTATRQTKGETSSGTTANQAVLTALIPSAGTLSPSFSSDVTYYTMTVPYSVTSLTFDGTVSNGGSFTVRRKNLNSPGVETNFTIVVKDANGTTVKEYIVSATREAKTTTAGTTTSSGSTGTTETASGNEDQTGNDDDGTDNGVALYGDRNIYYSNTPWLIFMVGFLAAVGVVLTILLVVPNRKRRRRHLRRDKPKHYE